MGLIIIILILVDMLFFMFYFGFINPLGLIDKDPIWLVLTQSFILSIVSCIFLKELKKKYRLDLALARANTQQMKGGTKT